jgi:hypothetical protein
MIKKKKRIRMIQILPLKDILLTASMVYLEGIAQVCRSALVIFKLLLCGGFNKAQYSTKRNIHPFDNIRKIYKLLSFLSKLVSTTLCK